MRPKTWTPRELKGVGSAGRWLADAGTHVPDPQPLDMPQMTWVPPRGSTHAENRAVHRWKTWWRHRSLLEGPVSTTLRPGPLRQSFGGIALQLDPTFLSRLQWAWVIGWHILLPAFTVGLASFIAVLEGLHFFTGKESWLRISNFWMRIFAVSFGMGVVTGIIMPFQFGTNWARFSDVTGNILSPLMAYEDLMAFFLEASFLGVLLFGRSLVPRWAHFFAADGGLRNADVILLDLVSK